jgi:hypothetical protein
MANKNCPKKFLLRVPVNRPTSNEGATFAGDERLKTLIEVDLVSIFETRSAFRSQPCHR